MAENQEVLEERVTKANNQRELTKTRIDQLQADLKSLFTKNPKKPRESLSETIKKIDELERSRTIVSLPLNEEKQILWKINALEKTKRAIEEHLNYEKRVQELKVQIQEYRKLMKAQSDEVSELEAQLAKEKLAKKASCTVEELKEVKINCPNERVGSVIGKSGSTVKKIEEKNRVALDIDSFKGIIHVYGTQESIDNAIVDINKIIQTIEVDMEVQEELVTYFSTKHIKALSKLRESNPDVYMDVSKRKNNNNKISLRGHPDDIEKVKMDINNFSTNFVTKEKRLTSHEAVALIGKKGSTIEKIVETFEVAIDVRKNVNNSAEESNSDDNYSLAIVSGPNDCVDNALTEIEDLLSANKEIIENITVAQIVRQTFLLGAGIKIKELQTQINESCGTNVSLSFENVEKKNNNHNHNSDSSTSNIIVKSKLMGMEAAMEAIREAVKEIEASTVYVAFDPFVVPLIIGKGGETIRKLQEGKLVHVEVDRNNNRVAINGLDKADIASVETAIKDIVDQNKVERIAVDSALIETQYRELTRSGKERNAIRALVRLDIDKDASEIVLRGKEEDLTKASEIVREFLSKNFIEEVPISAEDKDVLVSGGASSTIVKLSKDLDVNLSVDRTRFVLVVRGEHQKVESAVKEINAFLHGGEGNSVSRISVTHESLGYVIGKGGKKRQALESKYDGVSIHIHGSNRITLRGPEDRVKDCRVEILKIVASARIFRTVEIDSEQHDALMKSNMIRRITQSIPVQISVRDKIVDVRGFSADVRDAISLLNEQINGVYESCVELDASHLGKVRGACRDPSHFARMKQSTGAEVALDLASGSIVVRGKREQVKEAKVLVMRFLEFLLPSTFAIVEMTKPLHSTIGQGSSLADVSAVSGATLYLDRDISAVVIQSFGKGKVEEASKMLKEKIKEASKLAFFMQFAPEEAWLIPMIIGKNGDLVNSIRKQSSCHIDISKEDRSVLVTGTNEDDIAIAKASLERLVDKGRRETVIMDFPEEAVPTFCGRSRTHLTEFTREHGVDVQWIRKRPFKIKIQGDEANVIAAKQAAIDWLDAWGQTVTFTKIQLEQHQIPAVLGKKGSNVRAVEDEFGCKVELDRTTFTVTIRGGSAEKRELAAEKVKSFMNSSASSPRSRSRSAEPDQNGGERRGREQEPTKNASSKKETKAANGILSKNPDRSAEYPTRPVVVAGAEKPAKNNSSKNETESATESLAWDTSLSSGAGFSSNEVQGNDAKNVDTMLQVEG